MTLSDAALTEELAPVVAGLVDRHLTNTKEWFPHRLVPWSRGEDIGDDYEWDPAETELSPEVQSAMIVDLLRDDLQPRRQARAVGRLGPPLDGRGRPPFDRHP